MDWINIFIFSIFMLFGAGCVFLTLVGLPGGWIMVISAVGIELSNTLWGGVNIWGWLTVGICIGLMIVGETLELVASGLGSKVGGGSNRAMFGAIVGSIIGAILGTPLIPIPLIGTLIGAVIGTFFGTVLAELTHKKPPDLSEIAKSATGATIGRILGVLGKTGVASIVWCVFLISPFIGN